MNNETFWTALIAASAGIITALGLGKVVPTFLEWRKDKIDDARNKKTATHKEIGQLNERINTLERELSKHRAFEIQTRSTLNAMLPLMKEIMKEQPHHVMLLEQLEKNIVGQTTPSDGTN